MRYPTVAFVSAILVSVSTLAQSRAVNDAPVDEVASYGLVDAIIKGILEKLKPSLANLKINDVNETIASPFLNGSIIVNNILIEGVDQFNIAVLKSSLIPLRLTNMTLTWNKVAVTAGYDIDTIVRLPQLNTPIRVFAKGDSSLVLDGLFFTIGANIEMKNKVIQIKPKGLFGFDLNLESAEVTLTSLMGSSEFGSGMGTFLSKAIPDLIRILKKPLFDVFRDDIIRVVNDFLRGDNAPLSLDDFQDLQELSPYSVAGEVDSFFGQPLDQGMDLEDNEFNFNF